MHLYRSPYRSGLNSEPTLSRKGSPKSRILGSALSVNESHDLRDEPLTLKPPQS